MNPERLDRARERHLEQALAELGGERPGPLADVLIRRDASSLARAAARLDRAMRPRASAWALLAAALALVAVGAVWWSVAARGQRDVVAQDPVPAPVIADLAGLWARGPQLRGLVVAATSGPDGKRFAPGPERAVAVAEPRVVAALRAALAQGKPAESVGAGWRGRATLWFGTEAVEADLAVAGGELTLRFERFSGAVSLGAAAADLVAAFEASAAASVPVRRRIPVATVQEFAQALGSDRTLEITATEPLSLDDAFRDGVLSPDSPLQLLGADSSEPSPTLRGVRNLHVRSSHGKATLLVRSSLADVLRLHDCEGIVFEDLVFGHETTSQCQAPVLTVRGGKDLTLLRCELFGCGAMGLDAADTGAVHLVGTRVHTCSVAVMQLQRSGPLRCELGTFDNCELWQDAIGLDTAPATFVGCLLTRMKQQSSVDLFGGKGGPVVWRGGAIVDNIVRGVGGGELLRLDGAEVARNSR